MKTLLQAAIEFEASQGGHELHKAFWSDTQGAPFMMVSARSAFMAGAAAMAELFASGQAVKIEQAPRKYFISYHWLHTNGSPGGTDRWIVSAFSRNEALEQINLNTISTWATIIARPATEADEKIEGISRV